MKERRKSKRLHIPFNVEVIPSSDTDSYVSGEIKDFSPEGFSFEAKNITLGTNNAIKARFTIDPENGHINVTGRITWMIQIGVECQVGVEISEIDAGANKDLGFPFTMWKDKIKPN